MSGKEEPDQRQFAALPFMRDERGGPRILLVTSRGNGGWILPKGWPISGLTPAETAAREAYEEAGVVGTIVGDAPIGSYRYAKRRDARKPVLLEVEVFALEVREQLKRWPEKGQRRLRWCDPVEAARLVSEPELARTIADFAAAAVLEPRTPAILTDLAG